MRTNKRREIITRRGRRVIISRRGHRVRIVEGAKNGG